MTETCLNIGELDPLIETSPCDCNIFSSLNTGCRSVGENFNCRILPVECFASFEVQLCRVDLMYRIFCALIYRPLSYNTLFLKEFSDFLTTIVPNVDRLLILGEFNIHVCCPDKPLVSEFLQTIDYFNLSQSFVGPTHEKGHTLDLILSYGFTLQIVRIEDCSFSDHKPILFNTFLSHPVKQSSPGYYICPFNPDVSARFSGNLFF